MPKAKAKKKQTKKAAKTAKKSKPIATAAAAAVAAAPQPCIDAIDAAFIVGGCLPSGTHENDDTLEQTGLISENLRLIFRECVFNGVTNRGCDITRGQIPSGAATTVGEVQDAIIRNAR